MVPGVSCFQGRGMGVRAVAPVNRVGWRCAGHIPPVGAPRKPAWILRICTPTEIPSTVFGHMALPTRPPTNELGAESNAGIMLGPRGQLAPWSMFIDEREYVPELTWPSSTIVYERMRSDTQIEGLYAGLTWPITRYNWLIDPNGADENIVTALSEDLGLNIKDQQPKPRRRQRGRSNFRQHQVEALLALYYGHYCFEQVGAIGDDGLWHLKKLAPREPRTIQQINVAPDGGLVSIRQNINQAPLGINPYPEIPVDRLVWYAWQKEGANWVGRSILRPIYKNFVSKDRLMRIDVINHERAGGVPIVKSAPGSNAGEVADNSALAQAFRVTEHGGGALPPGADLAIVRGSNSDVIASIEYHDVQMARRFLMMLMQLGQTQSGSRALGDTFWDFFQLGQEGVADWFMGIFNEHVIEDWIDWNFGEQTDPVPMLVWERSEENQALSVQGLVQLVDAGAIVVDRDLEDQLRDRYNLTKKMAAAADPMPPVTVQAVPDPNADPAPQDPTNADPSPKPAKDTPPVAAKVGRGAAVDGTDSLAGDRRSTHLFDQEVM